MLRVMRSIAITAIVFILLLSTFRPTFAQRTGGPSDPVQAQAVLTVSESKRLIARAVVQMPIVRRALSDGLVIVTHGTTNTYVAEEILGKPIARPGFVSGMVLPMKGAKPLPKTENVPEVVLRNGKVVEGLSLQAAVRELKAGDVVIKGGNALNYQNKIAGVCIGNQDAGTSGMVMPYVVGRKAYLVIPIGLEKNISGNVVDVQKEMRNPIESLNPIPSMFLLTGEIVTEIEALNILTGVSAFQATAGGIDGAEGAVRLIMRGPRETVKKALTLVQSIQGEPPFVQ